MEPLNQNTGTGAFLKKSPPATLQQETTLGFLINFIGHKMYLTEITFALLVRWYNN